MVQVRSDLANFILDLKDEDCPQFGIHLAAYQGQVEDLTTLLADDKMKAECLDSGIRPFGATPLRLAATGRGMNINFVCLHPVIMSFLLTELLPDINTDKYRDNYNHHDDDVPFAVLKYFALTKKPQVCAEPEVT
jgi:hypothetical protein